MTDTPDLAHLRGGGAYFRAPCHGDALYSYFVYLAIPVHYLRESKICFIYMQQKKSEIDICSNKHEKGFVLK